MTDSWHSYPSIYALGHKAISDLLTVPVIVEEKIDGSQFSFGVFDGKICIRSKGVQMEIDAPEKMFSLAAKWVGENVSLLRDGWTYRGEYLSKPKHNSLAYSRCPKNNIIIFDVNIDHESYLSYEEKSIEAARIGLECVPLLRIGKVESMEDLKTLLDTDSTLGGTKVEGVVIKPVAYNLFGRDKKCLMGKFVSEQFKEIHSKEWKNSNPTGKDILGQIGDSLRTDARWEKSVQHLREQGKLTESPQDIGNLIKKVRDDLMKECQEVIAEQLMKWAMPHVLRVAMRGIPEWYKERLAKGQFPTQSL